MSNYDATLLPGRPLPLVPVLQGAPQDVVIWAKNRERNLRACGEAQLSFVDCRPCLVLVCSFSMLREALSPFGILARSGLESPYI